MGQRYPAWCYKKIIWEGSGLPDYEGGPEMAKWLDEMPVRLWNILTREKMETAAQILRLHEYELRRWRGFGSFTFADLVTCFETAGITVPWDRPPVRPRRVKR